MAKDFYISLPSNSSLTNFPDNHAGHFFTSLPKSINIDGEFEIGLSEIIFSISKIINCVFLVMAKKKEFIIC